MALIISPQLAKIVSFDDPDQGSSLSQTFPFVFAGNGPNQEMYNLLVNASMNQGMKNWWKMHQWA